MLRVVFSLCRIPQGWERICYCTTSPCVHDPYANESSNELVHLSLVASEVSYNPSYPVPLFSDALAAPGTARIPSTKSCMHVWVSHKRSSHSWCESGP